MAFCAAAGRRRCFNAAAPLASCYDFGPARLLHLAKSMRLTQPLGLLLLLGGGGSAHGRGGGSSGACRCGRFDRGPAELRPKARSSDPLDLLEALRCGAVRGLLLPGALGLLVLGHHLVRAVRV